MFEWLKKLESYIFNIEERNVRRIEEQPFDIEMTCPLCGSGNVKIKNVRLTFPGDAK